MEAEHQNNWFLRLIDKTIGGGEMTAQQLLSLFFPLFLDQLFIRIIGIINTTMVSSYGIEAMSAVSLVDSLNNFMVNFFIAISTGCTVVVAQYFGRRDKKNAVLTAAQSISSAILTALIIMLIILVFPTQISRGLFGSGNELFQDYAKFYLRASAISYPFFAMIQTGLGAMRGSGNTKVSVYFSTSFNALNVLLNILFLNVFHLGVTGLSLSLILSRVIVAFVLLWYMLRSNDEYPLKVRHFLVPNMSIQRSVFTVAVPVGLEQVFFHGGRTLVQVFIVGFGMMSTAANAASLPYSNFLQLIGATTQTGLVTIVGQCIGAGKIDEAKYYIKRITTASLLISSVLSLIFALILPFYLSLYHLPPEAYHIALILCIMTLIITPLTWPASFVNPNGLRAAGDARFTSMVALVTMWVSRVGLGYLLGVVLGFGIYGFWVAMFIEWIVRAVIFTIRLNGDKWYRHRVIKD